MKNNVLNLLKAYTVLYILTLFFVLLHLDASKRSTDHNRRNRRGAGTVYNVERNLYIGGSLVLWSHSISCSMVRNFIVSPDVVRRRD